MIPKSIAAKIKKELNKIKARYKRKYGAAIFDVEVIPQKKSLVLSGKVLAERQKKESFLAASQIASKKASPKSSGKYKLRGKTRANKSKTNIAIKNHIKVVSDPEKKLEIGWAVIKSDIADLWPKFFKKGAKKSDKARATQAVKDEVVRLLDKKTGQYLAQTSDLAIGWIWEEHISEIGSSFVRAKLIEEWEAEKRLAIGGKKVRIAKSEAERKKFVAFLGKYFNAPYLLGGLTDKGIDCSGLVQKFYLDIFGVLLPRHSADQAALGEEINFAQCRLGDLVFLRHRAKKYPHIGTVIDTNGKIDNFLILSARRENGGTVIQNFSEIMKSYKLISTRRIIEYIK